MRIRDTDRLTPAQLLAAVDAGGRFVYFEYCISLLLFTLWRVSDIHLLRQGERGLRRGLPYLMTSLFLGWWGVPWGVLYTPLALLATLSGGHDVTEEVRALLRTQDPELTDTPRV